MTTLNQILEAAEPSRLFRTPTRRRAAKSSANDRLSLVHAKRA
jgi:hypothetical protein